MSAKNTYEFPVRKISFTKTDGADPTANQGLIGWELEPPKEGRRYRIYLGNGSILSTSTVRDVSKGVEQLTVKTENSTYLVRYL